MDLDFNTHLADNYHSKLQSVRVISEDWFLRNMFCPRCGNLHVNHFENNRPVADFYCPTCNSEYELKSKSGTLNGKITDGAYHTMIQRITDNNNPDLFCLSYEQQSYRVKDMVFIPKYFFTPNIIEKRNPLSPTARRAGWTGCNILIGKLPEQAKIKIISDGCVNRVEDVVRTVLRCDALAIKDISARGWLLDILNCINGIKSQEFTLNDVYKFESNLALIHPHNKNIQPKIRQQLQLLRDKGFIEFLGNGKYRKL